MQGQVTVGLQTTWPLLGRQLWWHVHIVQNSFPSTSLTLTLSATFTFTFTVQSVQFLHHFWRWWRVGGQGQHAVNETVKVRATIIHQGISNGSSNITVERSLAGRRGRSTSWVFGRLQIKQVSVRVWTHIYNSASRSELKSKSQYQSLNSYIQPCTYVWTQKLKSVSVPKLVCRTLHLSMNSKGEVSISVWTHMKNSASKSEFKNRSQYQCLNSYTCRSQHLSLTSYVEVSIKVWPHMQKSASRSKLICRSPHEDLNSYVEVSIKLWPHTLKSASVKVWPHI